MALWYQNPVATIVGEPVKGVSVSKLTIWLKEFKPYTVAAFEAT